MRHIPRRTTSCCMQDQPKTTGTCLGDDIRMKFGVNKRKTLPTYLLRKENKYIKGSIKYIYYLME